MLKLKVHKLYDDVQIPIFSTKGSACFDIHAYYSPEVGYKKWSDNKKGFIDRKDLSITPEGTVDTTLRIRYNFDDLDSPQPSDYSLSIPKPSSGWCLSPSSIEFWLGDKYRIHERLKYNKVSDKWKREILYP